MFNLERTRQETIKLLKELQDKGFRYVVRDKEMPYLLCFSLKPKRYRDGEFWGYANSGENGAMPAHPIKNTDVTEINYSNRSAMLISEFLKSNADYEQLNDIGG